MKEKKARPDHDRLKELFHYEPETGIFVRRKPARSGPKDRKYGRIGAGRISELGYVMIMVDGINYNAGILAWVYTQGTWPDGRIKYINGNPLDNRVENIRVQNVPSSAIKGQRMTLDRLKELVHYEPETGHFTWRISSSVARPGERAGGGHGLGYRAMGLDYKKYLEHVLAWFYMTGEWPSSEIDHINGDKADNRWTNLRLATRSQNNHNRHLTRRNKSGVHGVHKHGNKFRARLYVSGVHVDLGVFDTLAEARAARIAAEKVHLGEFARQNESEPMAMYAMSEINGPAASDGIH